MNIRNAREWVADDPDYIPGGGPTACIGLLFAAVALVAIVAGVAALAWWVIA